MKVLHLISGGDIGGAKSSVFTLISELNKLEDVQAHLLCVIDGEFADDAKKAGIKVIVVPQKARYDLSAVIKISKIIKQENYDIIHFHGARANFLALFLRLMARRVFCTTIHSDYLLDFINDPYKQRFYTPINVFALKRFKYFITVSKVMGDTIQSRGFKNKVFCTVYNGIKTDEPKTIIPPDEFLKGYGLTNDKNAIYIGNASRLHKVKGVEVFLKACELVSKKYDNVRFLIAGSGDEYDNYKAFIAEHNLNDKVFMLGFVSDIFSFYNVLAINALTSYSETFPYSLLEGGLMKKATISSACGGTVEMIDEMRTGLLFPPGDHDKLAECICKLIEDKNLAKDLGENFYNDVINKFSSVQMAQMHYKWYSMFLNSKN